jgi:class 3 adenylate cyclase
VSSLRFRENYFFFQFALGVVICFAAAVWMYEVRNLFVFIAWPIAEGFTMAYILIAVSCLFYVRFVHLVWLCVLTAVWTVSMRSALCNTGKGCESDHTLALQQWVAVGGALLLVFSGRYLFETHSRLDFFMYRNLFRESERSDKLLLNILPAHVIQHLKVSGEENGVVCGVRGGGGCSVPTGIAQAYDHVTILFTDVVSFTTFSSHIAPEELVLFLNDLFTAFDDIAEETGLEKIKTIGDAYLCISGLPNPDPAHAVAAARMGLKIAALMKTGVFKDHNNLPLGCRIGIHSGSVVAGVIGRKKFIYDIWGDAVNTASRMESTGEPNRVHCSEGTAALIEQQANPGEFTLKCRGEISVKGKGTMRTFWVDDGADGEDISPHMYPKPLESNSPVFHPILE